MKPIIFKSLAGIILLFSLYSITKSQCISGDCENGFGTYKLSNNDQYIGEWRNGKYHGKGKYLFADGSYNDGEWVNGEFEGHGIHYSATDSSNKICEWVKGKVKNGQVKIVSPSYTFNGEYKNNEKNGKGKIIFKDGYEYDGDFKNGKYEGFGKTTYSNGDKYEGYYLNNVRQGKGTTRYTDGSIYEGNYKSGKLEGAVKIQYKNGDYYIGEFRNDQINGEGTYYLKNGNKLQGKWKDGRFFEKDDYETKNKNEEKTITNQQIITSKISITKSGLCEIPIKLNESLTLDFEIDTGASEVTLTPDVFYTLIRTKTVEKEDITEGSQYLMANGDLTKHLIKFNIKTLEINGIKLHNISAIVMEKLEASLLLGQNVLSQFGTIAIDYKNKTFNIIK